MWQRYAANTRRIILEAQGEAQRYGSPNIEIAHLFLSLLKNDLVTAQAFLRIGIPPERVQTAIEASLPTADALTNTTETPKLTPQCLFILQVAAMEARYHKNNFIEPEHLVLALLRDKDRFSDLTLGHILTPEMMETENTIIRVLQQLGIDTEQMRTQILYNRPDQTDPQQPAPPDDVVYNTTLRLQFILSLATLEAQQMGHDKVSVEHWLYVLLGERDDRWVKLLSECGLDVDHAFAHIAARLKKQSPPQAIRAQVIRALQQEIADLNRAKEAAVNDDEYERAAELRDRVEELQKSLEQLVDKWQQEGQF